MEQTKIQKLMDRIAISASGLCVVHCLATPLLLIAVPTISLTFMTDEAFHRTLVMLVVPVSFIALFLGCRRHKDRAVFILGGLGLISLLSTAYFAHDLIGELGERIATVISGVILSIGHIRNHHLCRRSECDI